MHLTRILQPVICLRISRNKYNVNVYAIISLLILFGVGCATTHEKKTQLTVDELFQRASNAQDIRELDEAIRDYSEVIVRDPNRTDAYYRRGICYLSKDIDLSISDLKKVVTIQPDNLQALFILADAHRLAGDVNAAVADYNKLLKQYAEKNKYPSDDSGDPFGKNSITYNDTFFYYNALYAKANMLFAARRYAEAKSAYDEYIVQTPSDIGYAIRNLPAYVGPIAAAGLIGVTAAIAVAAAETPQSPWTLSRSIAERRIKQIEPVARGDTNKPASRPNLKIGISRDNALLELIRSDFLLVDNNTTAASVGPNEIGDNTRITILKFENQTLIKIINHEINKISSNPNSMNNFDMTSRLNLGMRPEIVRKLTEVANDMVIYGDNDILISYGYLHPVKNSRLKIYIFNKDKFIGVSYNNIPK